MAYSIANFSLKKILHDIDWKLLLFLMLFLNVKLEIKVLAVVLIYLLRFDFRFKFSLKNSRLPLFYLLIMGIALIGLVVNRSYAAPNYLPLFLAGIVFWGLCLLAVHQIKLSVEKNDTEVSHRTILVFFVINALFSFCRIGLIMWETGAINPYVYQGEYQKYFIGTGDYIKGLTFDTSTTNAVLSAFGVIYFLIKKNPVMVLVCMTVLLLTGSNFTNLALMLVFIFLFVFMSTRDQKSMIVICLMLLVVFMAKISPENNEYSYETIKNAIHPPALPVASVTDQKTAVVVLSPQEIKDKTAKNYLDSLKAVLSKKQAPVKGPPVKLIPYAGDGRFIVPGPDINTLPYQTPIDTTATQREMLAFINIHKAHLPISAKNRDVLNMPGKGVALWQTVKFLRQHPSKIIAGDGLGNFSSKLAFKATDLGVEGAYPAKYAYISNDFMVNHLDVYLNFFSKRAELQSIINSPFSAYDQLIAEYGLLGLLAFCIFYLGFFVTRYKLLTYGIPLLLLMLGVFIIDYWFEQLSVVVFFELLLLLNIKENTLLTRANYAEQ